MTDSYNNVIINVYSFFFNLYSYLRADSRNIQSYNYLKRLILFDDTSAQASVFFFSKPYDPHHLQVVVFFAPPRFRYYRSTLRAIIPQTVVPIYN